MSAYCLTYLIQVIRWIAYCIPRSVVEISYLHIIFSSNLINEIVLSIYKRDTYIHIALFALSVKNTYRKKNIHKISDEDSIQ